MNAKAKKVIQTTLKQKAKNLDLSNCGLQEIPTAIQKMDWLETLNLDNNAISEIKNFKNLQQLKRLDFDNNQLSNIKGIEQLKNLQTLFLSRNKLNNIKGIEQLRNLQTLYLSRNKLNNIKGIGQLKNLQTLFLEQNKLNSIKDIGQLKNLQTLSLDQNKLNSIKGIEQLKNLQTLTLTQNQLNNIKGIEQLKNLQTLSLAQNQLNNIKGIEQLKKLQILFLYHNQLNDIRGIEQLKNLQNLYLDLNKLNRIKGIEQLKNLQTLYLEQNKLNNIKGIEQLKNLQTLFLSRNKLNNIKGIEQLKNLQTLYLSHNKLNSIKGIEQLKNLQTLHLSYTQIPATSLQAIPSSTINIRLEKTSIKSLMPLKTRILSDLKVLWEYSDTYTEEEIDTSNTDFYEVQLTSFTKNWFKKGIYVKDCLQLKEPAPEWIQLGTEVVKAYFQAIEEQGKEELNEVKILLIGDGGTGKTSLAYRLAHPRKQLPTVEQRTRGVEVYDWTFTKNRKKYIVHLWDFGGQVMYDMVHQYFYSQRSFYILLDSSRSGANENDSRLNQLLQSAELFGRNSPMMMIQNEHTGHSKQMDFHALQKNYPFLKEFNQVNLSTKEGLEDTKRLLKKYIEKMPSVGQVMPKKWMRVREKIEQLVQKRSTLSLTSFRRLCSRNGIKDTKGQNLLSRYFHQLGVFLHFQDKKDSSLKKLIILNREWATKASYKVFDAEFMEDRVPIGSFTLDDIALFWPEEEFQDYHVELLDLMKEFEICYELKDSNRFLVPRMMEKIGEKNYCQVEDCPLHFYYEYTFMPEGLLNRLSVRLHEMIGGAKGDLVWSDGVVFEDQGIKAELRELRLPDTNRISIKIIGPDAHYMSERLIREIDKINEVFNLERLKVSTKISCICSVCQNSDQPYFFDYQKVKKNLQNPNPKFHWNLCEESRERVEYHELLKTISHKVLKEIEEIQKKNKIGPFGEGKILFEGKEALGIAKGLLENNTAELSENIQEVKETIKKTAKKTRKTVKKQASLTQQEINQQLETIPIIFKENIQQSQEIILAEILGQLDSIQIDNAHTHELIEIVGTGIDTLFHKMPSKEDLLKALQEKAKLNVNEDLDLKEKLKVSLWLIPTLLKYEKELSGDILSTLKKTWQAHGFKRLFFKED